MDYIYNAYQWFREKLIPGLGDEHGSDSDQEPESDEDVPVTDDVSLPEAPADDIAQGTNVATTGGRDRRDLFSGQSKNVPDTTNTHNHGQQSGASPTGSFRKNRATPPTVSSRPRFRQSHNEDDLPLPPDYYQRPDQALQSHVKRMKRRLEDRLEERHDRRSNKYRRLAPFANGRGRWYAPGTQVSEPDEYTIERQEYEEWRDKQDQRDHERDGQPSLQPGHSLPAIPNAIDNVGRGSCIDTQRNARQELIELERKAQQNRRLSQTSPTKSAGGDNNRDCSTPRSGQSANSPRPSSRGSARQYPQPGTGGQRISSQPPSTPRSPQQSPKKTPSPKHLASSAPMPKERSPRRSPSRQERELDKLRIDGTEKFFPRNYTQSTPSDGHNAGTAKGKSTLPLLQTDTGSSVSAPKVKPGRKAFQRGPKPFLTLRVEATEETREVITELADLDWGDEDTSGTGLQCLCFAIRQSIVAQYPGAYVPDQESLPEIVHASMAGEDVQTLNQTVDVRRYKRNFTADEANAAVAGLGYHLIIVEELGSQGPYILDKNGYIPPGEEKYLVLHHKASHWQSIGPKAQRALRVGSTRREPLEARRRKQLRIVLGTVIHDPIFDAGASIDELYITVNKNLPKRLKVPFKRAEIRDSLIWYDRNHAEGILTHYSGASGTAHRRYLVPSQCAGRGCACGLIITPARLAQFRAGLAGAIHTPEFDNGEDVDAILTLVNSFWGVEDEEVSEFDHEETRAGLESLSLNLDLVDFSPDDDAAKRIEGVPVKCVGKSCPCGFRAAHAGSPAESRRSSHASRKSPAPERRGSPREQKSPRESRKSPTAIEDTNVQITPQRLQAYRTALNTVMRDPDRADRYLNRGVREKLVHNQINNLFDRMKLRVSIKQFESPEHLAALRELDAQADMIQYPIGKDRVRRIPDEDDIAPRSTDNRAPLNDIGGALSDTFGTKPPSTKPPSPKNSPKSPPPLSRQSRSPTNDGEDLSTTTEKLDSPSTKRKSASLPDITPASPAKKQKTPSPACVESGIQSQETAIRKILEQCGQQPSSSPAAPAVPGFTKAGKKKHPMSGLHKKLNDNMGKGGK